MAEKKKKKWIKGALEGAHGQFKAKAEAAGKSTKEFAQEHVGSKGKLGKQARLAATLMGMHHEKKEGKKKPSSMGMMKKMYGKKSVEEK